MVRPVGVAAVAGLAFALTGTPGLAHKQTFDPPRNITFHSFPWAPDHSVYIYGSIRGRPPCLRGRIVRIWHVVGEAGEIVATLHAGHAEPLRSYWGTVLQDPPYGYYQVEVRRQVTRTPHHVRRCPGGSSGMFWLPPAPG